MRKNETKETPVIQVSVGPSLKMLWKEQPTKTQDVNRLPNLFSDLAVIAILPFMTTTDTGRCIIPHERSITTRVTDNGGIAVCRSAAGDSMRLVVLIQGLR